MTRATARLSDKCYVLFLYELYIRNVFISDRFAVRNSIESDISLSIICFTYMLRLFSGRQLPINSVR